MAEIRREVVRSVRALTIACAAAALWLGVSACSRDGETAPAGPRGRARPDVVLIAIDTMRADRLSAVRGETPLTPLLGRIAAEGVRFTQAYAHAPWTLPSMASLLTSTPPATHGAGRDGSALTPLGDDVGTLAEAFAAAGYQTRAVTNVMWLTPRYGLLRGFDRYDDRPLTSNTHMRPAADTTDDALAQAARDDDRPLFLFVHYFDPHLVYDPPREYRRRFAAEADRNLAGPLFGTIRQMKRFRRGEIDVSDIPVARLEKLYDGEIAYTDAEVGRLIDGLRAMSGSRGLVVAITSDHGEEFLEHGGFEHGHTLYEEMMRVPLVFAGAGVARGLTVDARVGTIDVGPTLCELAGVAPPPGAVGRSLVEAWRGGSLPARAHLAQGNMWGPKLYAIWEGRHKLIRTPDGEHLFDLTSDPAETHDLAAGEPALRARLSRDLDGLLATFRAAAGRGAEEIEANDELRRRLESLGYAD